MNDVHSGFPSCRANRSCDGTPLPADVVLAGSGVGDRPRINRRGLAVRIVARASRQCAYTATAVAHDERSGLRGGTA